MKNEESTILLNSLSKFANSNIYRKDETIKILDGCLDIVDGHFVYFVSEFG